MKTWLSAYLWGVLIMCGIVGSSAAVVLTFVYISERIGMGGAALLYFVLLAAPMPGACVWDYTHNRKGK